jgi:hypothetical protein
VVFDDPLQTQTTTIVFLFGTQNTNGDRFTITLADPIERCQGAGWWATCETPRPGSPSATG